MTVGVRNFPRKALDGLSRAIKTIRGQRGAPDGFVGTNNQGLAETEQLGTGTAAVTTFLRGDNTWGAAALADGDYGDIVLDTGFWFVQSAGGTLFLDSTATTAEIQAALNSLTTGGIVHLAPGNYALTATLYLSHPGLTLRGSGKGSTSLYLTGSRNTDIVVIEHYFCSVEDLTISGTNPAYVNGSGAAGTGRGIVIAQPSTAGFFANPLYSALPGPANECTFPAIRRVAVTNTGSWCIYDSGLKTFTTAGNNWTTPLANTTFAISVLLHLEDVDVAYWASNGGLFIGSGAAAPSAKHLKTNGYTYNTYTQVTGVGAVPTNDMGGVFLYNVYGAVFDDCYFQSPVDGGTLPGTDACLLSILSSHSVALNNPKFECLNSGLTCPDSNNGAGGRQYYFITACNSSAIEVIDSDFQSRLDDASLGNSTLSNWGAKIFRSSDSPSAVGISFIRGVCYHGRATIGAPSGAKDTGDPTTWDRNDFVFAGNLDGDSTASTITIEDFVVVNNSTGKLREATVPLNATFTVANCTTAGVPSTTLTTTTGTFAAVNNGDSVTDLLGPTTTRVRYVTATGTLITEAALTVAGGSTLTFTPAGMNIGVKPNFKLTQRHGSFRPGTWQTCDLTGAGDKNDFFARTSLSQPTYGGVFGYVASGDSTEGLWITNSNDNAPRQVPFYRRRSSFWTGPMQGDLNYLTGNESLHTYSSAGAEWKQVFSLLRLSTATGDLPYYSAASTPARLPVGSSNQWLKVSSGAPAWSDPDFLDSLFRVSDNGDSTKKLAMECSGITTATTRTLSAQNLSGAIPIVGDDPPGVAAGSLGKVDLTARVANIATTNLSSTPPAGFYEVEVYLMCTAADVAAGSLAVTIGWTDNVGATTSTPITGFLLTGTGRTTGRQLVRVSSGDISYAVTVTGGYGTSQYDVYARVVAMG